MEDLRQKRILVTGGAGCIGSFVVDALLNEGVKEVIVLDNLNRGSRDNLRAAMTSGRVTFVEGDIRDRVLLDKIFSGIDYCFHLASLKIIHCMAEPRHALEVNSEGTFNVLEACVTHKVKKIIFASTASVYGQADTFPIKEKHHPYNNFSLYGALKTAGEMMCRSFGQMYGLRYNTLRYFNVYGPRMDSHGQYTEVMIRWYHAIRSGQPPVIYGNGKQTMDFIYVEDVARATLLALKADACGEVFNCASGRETSLAQLCGLIIRAMKAKVSPKYVALPDDRRKIEVFRRKADVQKAKRLISFRAQVSLEDGLSRLVHWLDEKKI